MYQKGTQFCGIMVYYESINRELKTKLIYECRCDERLKTKAEESTRLVYTGLFGELEHLKIETRLIDEMFASVILVVSSVLPAVDGSLPSSST